MVLDQSKPIVKNFQFKSRHTKKLTKKQKQAELTLNSFSGNHVDVVDHASLAADPDISKKGCFETPVVNVTQCPSYMQSWNAYITKGYRLCRRKREMFLSLFYWHNCWLDTMTSLSNMVHATILLFYAFSWSCFKTEDKWIFFTFFLTALIHSPPSAAYHLIGCSGRSYSDYLFYQRLDFVMIFVSSIPLAFSLCYFTFYTLPIFTYISVLGVAFTACYTAYHISEPMDPPRRLKLVSVLVFFYLLPVLYQIGLELIAGNFTSKTLLWGLGIIASLAMGGYTYGARFPEVVWPDCPVSSHSLMHVGVNLAYFSEFFFIFNRCVLRKEYFV